MNKAHKFVDKILRIKERSNRKELYNALSPYAKDLYKIIMSTWDLGIIPELANFAVPSYLKQKLSSQIPVAEIEEVLGYLLTSEKFSYHQQSEYELLEATLNNDFCSYADKWFWVENGYYESKVLSAEYFKSKVEGLSKKNIKNKLDKIKNYPLAVSDRKKEIINQYKLPPKIIDMTDNLAHSIWWQDNRKALVLWLHSAVDIFSQAAEDELKIDFDKILYYGAEEWLSLFTKKVIKVPQDILDKRYNLSLFDIAVSKGKFKQLYGSGAQRIIKQLNLDEKKVTIKNELKGTSVSRGKVSGIVRVLLSHRQADKIKQGEILVTPMTSPDYIVAMRKASAIITDVGGLMSHAAIISRELGIPCIVGTKNATKVLKDGDKVEVDANNGIIRRL